MRRKIPEHGSGRFDEDLLRFMECIVVELDPMGRILRMNPFAEDFLGRCATESAGEPFIGALVPERSSNGGNQAALFEQFIRNPEKGAGFGMEVRISDGTLKNITWRADVHLNDNGEVARIICIGVDRRAIMEKERGFHQAYDLLERFVAASKVCAFEVNSENRFIYVSPGIENICGYLPKDIVGQARNMLLGAEEKNRCGGMMETGIRKAAQRIHSVKKVRHTDDTPLWCEMDEILSYHENGEFEGIVGLCRNIDHQKKIELKMSAKEKELRFCFDHVQVLLIVIDEGGGVRSVNRAGAEMFGMQPKEMLGHVFTEFLPDFERERVFKMFKKKFRAAMAQKDSRTVDMGGFLTKIQTPEGLKDIFFHKNGIKIYNNGKLEGILHTAVDITETVKAREELKRHQNHLEQLVAERTAELQGLQDEMMHRERLTALGKMAGVISQEIRTPLSTISNSLFVLNERLKEKEVGVKRSLERANRAIKRCYGIVDEFEIFTQTDALARKNTEIDKWLGGILDQLSKDEAPPVFRDLNSGVTVEIDQHRVQRAILNVVENARQAGQDRSEGRIVVKSKQVFNRLEIEIEDEGVGIMRKDLERVFEPLFSTKSFGLGLGLHISRQIMEQHGGGISIESEEKKGTRVLLWLPLDPTSTAS